jgi:uncharacterized protein (TIGR03437 family)
MGSYKNPFTVIQSVCKATLILPLTLAVLITTAVSAQTVDRAKLLEEIIALKQQVENTTDPAEKKRLTELLNQKERLFLEPAASDREAFSAFLKQTGTGISRLMPREGFDGVLFMRGGGSYYSFVRQEQPYTFGTDLGLERGNLRVGFAGADFGFLTRLGDLPIESVTLETPGVVWLSGFAPPLDEPGARLQQQRASAGFVENNFSYRNRLPLEIGATYALRSVSYEDNDILVVFRTHRLDTDGSLIFAWKAIKRYATPQLNGGTLATVSAASYAHSNFAKEIIVTAFGKDFASGNFFATTFPLPLQLGGAYVSIQDSSDRPFQQYAPLFVVTPGQVNYLIPPETAEGYALVTVRAASGEQFRELIRIGKTAPALFTANADGAGVVAALALRVRGTEQIYEPVARFDNTLGKFVSTPIDLGVDGDQVFLVLFGSGIRGRSSLQNVIVKIGVVELPASFAGAQGLSGLDQLNVPLSSILTGLGEVDLTLTVDGQVANIVRINFK